MKPFGASLGPAIAWLKSGGSPVGRVYWTAWLAFALLAALPFATATWIQPEHAIWLTIIGLTVLTYCGIRALVLLRRQRQMEGRRTWVTSVMAFVLALSAAMSILTVLPDVPISLLDDLARFPAFAVRLGSFWIYQLLALLIVAGLILLEGWLPIVAIKLSHRRADAWQRELAVSRVRLATTYLLSVLLLPAMMLWGYEASRQRGLKAFLAVYENRILATEQTMVQEGETIRIEPSGPILCSLRDCFEQREICLVTLRTTDKEPSVVFKKPRWPDDDLLDNGYFLRRGVHVITLPPTWSQAFLNELAKERPPGPDRMRCARSKYFRVHQLTYHGSSLEMQFFPPWYLMPPPVHGHLD